MSASNGRVTPRIMLAPALLCVVFVMCAVVSWTFRNAPLAPTNYCPQVPVVAPAEHLRFENSSHFFSPRYRKRSAEYLGGAIRIPTVSFDDMGKVGEDERFDVFNDFHQYLVQTFPLAAKHGNIEYVNTHGMLYTFQGKDSSLKPIVLMAHQDVVPVNPASENLWDHGSFSGHYDGEFVYGRGSCDCKNEVVGILESVESLLHQGWSPERTVLLSFGFDEEISGNRGAGHLAAFIEERYGPDSIAGIIDEGPGLTEAFGNVWAVPAVAEKGYVDIHVTVDTPGGHSSVPPDHTGIGIISELVTVLEANPFKPTLDDGNVGIDQLHCMAEHGTLPKPIKDAALDVSRGHNRQTLIDFISSIPETRYNIRTSQAVDIIKGGVKINALPEQVNLTVNYRVSVDSSVDEVVATVVNHIRGIAKKYDLSVKVGDKNLADGKAGAFTVWTSGTIQVARKSPTTGPFWDVMIGSTRNIYENVLPNVLNIPSKRVYSMPILMAGNTDTAHYWNLTKNIYRYTAMSLGDMFGLHTVNEKVRLTGHLTVVAWYYELLLDFTL